MSRSGRETLPNVREWCEALLDVLEWSVDTPECLVGLSGCLGVVGRPPLMYGSDRQALSDVRECQEDLPNILKWS